MTVKWHGLSSQPRPLPGGGPQGSTFGNLEFDVNSNNNADHILPHMRFKFVDDLSKLEKLNLLLVGLTSYNFKAHVASDIGVHQKFLPPANFLGQESLNRVEQWTRDNRTKLNVKKVKDNDIQFHQRPSIFK